MPSQITPEPPVTPTTLAIRTFQTFFGVPPGMTLELPAADVSAATVKTFFETHGFAVFSVTQIATARWHANVRGPSPMQAFGTAARFAREHKGHEVRLLIG